MDYWFCHSWDSEVWLLRVMMKSLLGTWKGISDFLNLLFLVKLFYLRVITEGNSSLIIFVFRNSEVLKCLSFQLQSISYWDALWRSWKSRGWSSCTFFKCLPWYDFTESDIVFTFSRVAKLYGVIFRDRLHIRNVLILFFDPCLLFNSNIWFMSFNELASNCVPVVLIPQLLQFIGSFLAVNLLLNELACLYKWIIFLGGSYYSNPFRGWRVL